MLVTQLHSVNTLSSTRKTIVHVQERSLQYSPIVWDPRLNRVFFNTTDCLLNEFITATFDAASWLLQLTIRQHGF